MDQIRNVLRQRAMQSKNPGKRNPTEARATQPHDGTPDNGKIGTDIPRYPDSASLLQCDTANHTISQWEYRSSFTRSINLHISRSLSLRIISTQYGAPEHPISNQNLQPRFHNRSSLKLANHRRSTKATSDTPPPTEMTTSNLRSASQKTPLIAPPHTWHTRRRSNFRFHILRLLCQASFAAHI